MGLSPVGLWPQVLCVEDVLKILVGAEWSICENWVLGMFVAATSVLFLRQMLDFHLFIIQT
jgi:hypothetical protein